MAGMVVGDYPDNSVVCHARRLAGLRQDVFVTVLSSACTAAVCRCPSSLTYTTRTVLLRKRRLPKLPRVGQARQVGDRFARPERAVARSSEIYWPRVCMP